MLALGNQKLLGSLLLLGTRMIYNGMILCVILLDYYPCFRAGY